MIPSEMVDRFPSAFGEDQVVAFFAQRVLDEFAGNG
jgi:hypothetical protein